MDWFGSNVWSPEAMKSVESWIECLQAECAVDTVKARKEANACVYDPTQQKSVMDYFYKKIDLLKTASSSIDIDVMRDEIWLDLPSDFRVHLVWPQISNLAITQFGRVLYEKDVAYRENRAQRLKKEEFRDWKIGKESRPEPSRKDNRGYDRNTKVTSDSQSHASNIESLSSDGRRKMETSKKDPLIPPSLSRDQWRKDKEGRAMMRKCKSAINGSTMLSVQNDLLHTM